jgi:type I restriction enzyme S subunit
MSWDTVKISDFAEVVTGGTPSTGTVAYWENGTIPWLPSGACQNCEVTSAEKSITELGLRESSAKMMPPDTVLIALTGATTGKVGLLKIDACANQSVTGILPNGKFVSKYLFHYLMSMRDKVIADSYGGAQKHISQGYVKNICVVFPPRDVQRQIAAVLDKAQAIIAARREQIAVLDKLAKDLFVDMFGDPVSNNKGFDIALMGTLGEYKNGMNYSQSDNGYSIPCLGVGDFGALYEIDDVATLPRIQLSSAPADSYYLKDGDIVFVRSNGNRALVGRSVEVNVNDNKAVFSGFCIRFRIQCDSILPKYLNHALHMDSLRNELFRTTRGANIQNLNQQMLSALRIPVPPIEIQKSFDRQIRAISEQKALLTASLAELETLYQSLTERAFSGELFG